MVGNNSVRCPTDWLDCFRFLVPLRKFEVSGTGIVRALSIALPSCFQKQYIQPDLDSGSLAPVVDSQVPGRGVHHISSVLADFRYTKPASCGPCVLALSLSRWVFLTVGTG